MTVWDYLNGLLDGGFWRGIIGFSVLTWIAALVGGCAVQCCNGLRRKP